MPAEETAPTDTESEAPGEDRLARLEREVAALRAELESLREALGESAEGD